MFDLKITQRLVVNGNRLYVLDKWLIAFLQLKLAIHISDERSIIIPYHCPRMDLMASGIGVGECGTSEPTSICPACRTHARYLHTVQPSYQYAVTGSRPVDSEDDH